MAAASPAWPDTPLLTYLLAAGCMMLALWLFHSLLCRLLGRGDALLAVLAALCLTYATDRLVVYNHNVVMLLPLIAGVFTLLWRTTERPSLAAWAGVGVLLGFGMLAKYQMVLVALCVGIWWLRIGGWRVPTHRTGLALALAIAAAVLSPHLAWLMHNGWAPLSYASDSSLGAHLPWVQRPLHVLLWLVDWFGNRLAPAWAMVFAVAAMLTLDRSRPRAPVPALGRLQRDFLLLAGFGPMWMMAGLCLIGGIYLQMKWSTAFALWTVPAVVALLPRRWRCGDAPPVGGVWWLFGLLQLVLLAYTWQTVRHSALQPMAAGGWKQRDFTAMAQRMQAALDGPVDVVNGPYGVAGMLARALPGQPKVLIDGKLARSPWLTAADLCSARIVSVWPTCHVPAGAHTLAPGWAWWPQASPPPIPPGPGAALEHLRRSQAAHSGGTAAVYCP